jgi:L-histidine N-alpha-methyltransferase
VLEAAYDDELGVTAAFNLNLLRHLNRLLGADFDVRDWRHVALFDRPPRASRCTWKAREAPPRCAGPVASGTLPRRAHAHRELPSGSPGDFGAAARRRFARVQRWTDAQAGSACSWR